MSRRLRLVRTDRDVQSRDEIAAISSLLADAEILAGSVPEDAPLSLRRLRRSVREAASDAEEALAALNLVADQGQRLATEASRAPSPRMVLRTTPEQT